MQVIRAATNMCLRAKHIRPAVSELHQEIRREISLNGNVSEWLVKPDY